MGLNSQGNGNVNGKVPNGRALDKEVPSSTSTPAITVLASTSTSTIATSIPNMDVSTSTTISTSATVTPIVSIAISLPTSLPTSIPIPTHTPSRTKNLTLTAPFTHAQVDIPTTYTPHMSITTPVTVPAHTSPGPHVLISTLAQTSVAILRPSFTSHIPTALVTSTLGAPIFLQASSLTTTVSGVPDAPPIFDTTMGEASTSVEARDVSSSFQMPPYVPPILQLPPFGGITGATAMIYQLIGAINNDNQESTQRQREMQADINDLMEAQAYLIKQLESKKDQIQEIEYALKE